MTSKKDIQKKIGKKIFFDYEETLAAKLDYVSGIIFFDQILKGKSLKDNNAVIHVEKYPKGLLFKIAKGFGGIKTYPFPVSNDEIKDIIIRKTKNGPCALFLKLAESEEIEFVIKENDLSEVGQFFNSYLTKFNKRNLISELQESYRLDKEKKSPASEKSILLTEGRIRRTTYWIRVLIVSVINSLIPLILEESGYAFLAPDWNGDNAIADIISLIFSIFIIIQGVKRMHDVDKSGWYLFIPIYNVILAFTEGTKGVNKYGADPKMR